jgi:hypothetical protein
VSILKKMLGQLFNLSHFSVKTQTHKNEARG